MKYLYQITDNNERRYIEHFVSSVEDTGKVICWLFRFLVIIPIMLFKISIEQFINVAQGEASATDLFIALVLFLFGLFFAYASYFLGFKNPIEEKKFIDRVKNGQLCIQKVQILNTQMTTNTKANMLSYYVTSYANHKGQINNGSFLRAYNYSNRNMYQYGIFYYDMVKPNMHKGIIPLYHAQ